ncbi:MAG: hypothetical protein ACREBC_38475, partial [Pyrinomonadaceae bacterium]
GFPVPTADSARGDTHSSAAVDTTVSRAQVKLAGQRVLFQQPKELGATLKQVQSGSVDLGMTKN